jgi:hypothetical protein
MGWVIQWGNTGSSYPSESEKLGPPTSGGRVKERRLRGGAAPRNLAGVGERHQWPRGRGGSDWHLRERDKAWSAVGAEASVGSAVAGYGLSARKEGIETDVWGHVAGISTHIPCISNQTRTRNRDEPNPHNQTRNGFTPFQKSGMDPSPKTKQMFSFSPHPLVFVGRFACARNYIFLPLALVLTFVTVQRNFSKQHHSNILLWCDQLLSSWSTLSDHTLKAKSALTSFNGGFIWRGSSPHISVVSSVL